MRIYSQEYEERIRAQMAVREWARSKLLDPQQGAALEAELRVDVRRTNDFLRAALALFTTLIVWALVALLVEEFGLKRGTSLALATGLSALVAIVLADALAGRLRLYRFGVEEALAAAGVILLSISVAEAWHGSSYESYGEGAVRLGLSIGSAGAFYVYRRFGFVYAAAGSMVCMALIPFQLHLPDATKHALAALVFACAFVAARSKRLQYHDDFPGDEYAELQAVAWAGVYLALNLQLWWWLRGYAHGMFYWVMYAMTWVLPTVGLALGIRGKDRALMDVSIAMALVTLVTNKPYLGWPRHTWDPILLGVFVVAVALVLRRWLSTGTEGQRNGFTAAQLLTEESRALTLLRAASTIVQPHAAAARAEPADTSSFDGGRSGGGGGGASY